eukprot:1156920-Pelagomonas_calceolata.AAC.2
MVLLVLTISISLLRGCRQWIMVGPAKPPNPSSYNPTKYDLPHTLWIGEADGAVTVHSYHTLCAPEHRHIEASTLAPAGT